MKPNIFTPPLPVPGGHVPVPLPKFPGGHVPGPEPELPNITDKGANWTPQWPDIQIPHPDIRLPDWFPGQGAGADNDEDQQISAVLGIPPEQITQEIRDWWSSRPQPQAQPQDVPQPGSDGMGAGLQIGPVHVSTTMRQPMRMPSSRMTVSKRAGWTPRAGGMKRRPSMGTSAMMDLSA